MRGARFSRRGNPVHSCNGREQLEKGGAMINGIASSQTTFLAMTRFFCFLGGGRAFAINHEHKNLSNI